MDKEDTCRRIVCKKIRLDITNLINNTDDVKLIKKYSRIIDYINFLEKH